MAGFVYIMSNPSLGSRIKIGKSDRDPHEFRKSELESTGVPEPFNVEYYAYVNDHHMVERQTHVKLDQFRPNKKREFFNCSIPEAIHTIKTIADKMIKYEENRYQSPEEIEHIKEIERLEEKRKQEGIKADFLKSEKEAKARRLVTISNSSKRLSSHLGNVLDDDMTSRIDGSIRVALAGIKGAYDSYKGSWHSEKKATYRQKWDPIIDVIIKESQRELKKDLSDGLNDRINQLHDAEIKKFKTRLTTER